MRDAKIIIARYKKGIMSRQNVIDYINSKYHKLYDKNVIDFIMAQL